MKKAYFHLPGLFEAYEFYRVFLPVFYENRHYFYDYAEIASIYGAPPECIWGGGRFGDGRYNPHEVLNLLGKYGISARLAFSNSLLRHEHLSDRRCNELCRIFDKKTDVQNGVIVHSEILLRYLMENYRNLYLVSSTTKVITDSDAFEQEAKRQEFSYIVPDFRLNRRFDKLFSMNQAEKDKTEFLCNECCSIKCADRKACYENVSRRILGEDCPEHICTSPDGSRGYRFSAAMENPSFISLDDIQEIYLKNGFSNFKIEGRGLGSAVLLEFLLYYLAKPQYHIHIREKIYLDSMLDIF